MYSQKKNSSVGMTVWIVSDAFWEAVAPLIPKSVRDKKRRYKRKIGGGRKPLEARTVFSAIVYALRTGTRWKALPKEVFGSQSAIHRYFKEWERKGFFLKLWQKGLSEYAEMEGIAWEWKSSDDSMKNPPPVPGRSGGMLANWRRKGNKTLYPCKRTWRPVTKRRNRDTMHDSNHIIV